MVCPVCGEWAPMSMGRAARVIGWHGTGRTAQGQCLAVGYDLRAARDMGRILEADPRLPERAHP